MENKLVSLILKVGMAVLFIIGVVLISKNISLAPSSDEDLALTDQSFFVTEYELPLEEGKKRDPKQPKEKEVHYSFVLDTKNNEVYDLDAKKVYEYAPFVESKGKTMTVKGDLKEGMVNELTLKNFEFQKATSRSISFTKWLLILAGIAIALFTVINIGKNPKRFLRSSIGLIALNCYWIHLL